MENTEVYLEDDSNYIFNLTSVRLTSYAQNVTVAKRATLIATSAVQSGLSGQSAFNILKNTDLRISEIIASGDFTEREKLYIETSPVTIMSVRTTIQVDNLNIISDFEASNKDIFLFLINLQHKAVIMDNIDFNMTGTIVETYDPSDVSLTNTLIDAWAIDKGFMFYIDCQYPEAILNSTIEVHNMTAFSSSQRDSAERPRIFAYIGPGNVTASNIDLLNYYTLVASLTSSWDVLQDPICLPDDSVTQVIDAQGLKWAVYDNERLQKQNAFVFNIESALYRYFIVNLHDLYLPAQNVDFTALAVNGRPNHVVHYSNGVHKNYDARISLILIIG